MFSRPNIDRTQCVTESVQCRSTTNSIICFGRAESMFHTIFYLPVRITLPRHRPRHLKLKVMGHVRLSCTSWLATTYGVVSTFLLVDSWPNAMSCLAVSCPIKLHHGRCSQGAAISPDDVMWWRFAIKQVPLARDSLSPIRFRNRATST